MSVFSMLKSAHKNLACMIVFLFIISSLSGCIAPELKTMPTSTPAPTASPTTATPTATLTPTPTPTPASILKPGFTIPQIPSYQPHDFESKPSAYATLSPGYKFSIETERAKFYDSSRGVIKIWLKNTGDNALFVYQYGLRPDWLEGGWYPSNTGLTINPGEKKYIGMTSVKVEDDINSFSVEYGFSLIAKTSRGEWYDYGTVFMDPVTIQVNPLIEDTAPKYTTNWYTSKKVNDLVNPTDPKVREVAVQIAKAHPGKYNVYQLCALFDYVSNNIEYVSDPRGTDYWAKPSETLTIGAGDCDDHAILMASLIEAIGGTTRIYLTEDHMFAAVYIGEGDYVSAVAEAIRTYYNTPVTIYYETNKDGAWLMLEPTGGLYAGALPVGTKPTKTGWAYENTTTVTIVDIKS